MTGSHTFSLIASDGTEETRRQVTVSVIKVNDPPEIRFYPEKQIFYANRQNHILLPSGCITDPDTGDKLSFSLSTENQSAIPNWLCEDSDPFRGKGIYNYYDRHHRP